MDNGLFIFFIGFWVLLGISILYIGWSKVWIYLYIPTMSPPFADMRTVQSALEATTQGLDPYINNPSDPWRRVLNYPSVWLLIANALNFGNDAYYLAFEILITLGYIVSCAMLLKKYPSFWLLLTMLSGSSLLGVERGNNDIFIFTLLYCSALAPLFWKALLIAASITLKIYPVFAVISLAKHKKFFVAIICGAVVYFISVNDELQKISSGLISGPSLSYGLRNISAWFMWAQKMSVNMWLIGALLIIPPSICAIYCFKAEQLVPALQSGEEEVYLFLIGASIFIGTFLSASNFDYRLLFLSFCIPYILRTRFIVLRYLVPLAIVIATNQLYLESQLQKTAIMICIIAKCIAFVSIFFLFLLELKKQLSNLKKSKVNHLDNESLGRSM